MPIACTLHKASKAQDKGALPIAFWQKFKLQLLPRPLAIVHGSYVFASVVDSAGTLSSGRGSVVRHWTGISPSLVMKL
jgi:hypothetical protein